MSLKHRAKTERKGAKETESNRQQTKQRENKTSANRNAKRRLIALTAKTVVTMCFLSWSELI